MSDNPEEIEKIVAKALALNDEPIDLVHYKSNIITVELDNGEIIEVKD